MLLPFDELVAVCLDDSGFVSGIDPHPPSASAVMHRQAESALRAFMVFRRPNVMGLSWSGQ
ncbi:hypothetical protein [Bifidobacterium dentium]|uniref:hypothetical protein n=1 Tax=Bifidobacterium dentium TaxID=1689 RepID=UPI0018C2233E|nr:hypothetical protein [Bifidobacterium dentium]